MIITVQSSASTMTYLGRHTYRPAPCFENTMNVAAMLPIRRENEILVGICGCLTEQLVNEMFTVTDVQNKLRQFVEVYGVGETDEFFVDRVSAFFSQGS